MNEQTIARRQENRATERGSLLQRKCACGQHTMASGECVECRRKRQAGLSAAVQPKLTIGVPGDKYEREADRAAEAVMRAPVCRLPSPSPIGSIQRTVTSGDTYATGETARQIEALQGRGKPLSPSIRSFFEPRFGHDFADVRVHTDAQAAKSARVINALAYTAGQHIVFDTGQFAPQTDAGKGLLAHELTHVLQQRESESMVQRAQVERIHTPARSGTPHFIYELDQARHTFADLANYYGVSTNDIQSQNPDANPATLQMGQRIQVPAFDPPPVNALPAGPRAPGMVISSGTANITTRWNSSRDANRLGSVARGTTVGTTAPVTYIDVNEVRSPAQGVLQELRQRQRIVGGDVAAYLPLNNLRHTFRGPSNTEINLLARMIWGEQGNQGDDAMRGAAWIVKNRFNAGWGTYSQIITQPNQFQGLVSQAKVQNLAGANLAAWRSAQQIASQVVNGQVPDPTNGAFYFGNGPQVLRAMQRCARQSSNFSHGTIAGTNFHYSNGDYTSGCTVP